MHQASGALASIIRFYISIEDGECTVERDLGHWRAQVLEHKYNGMPLANDYVMLHLNGPSTLAEFSEGVDPHVSLSPFARECASLWRQIFGWRRNHYNKAATLASRAKSVAQRGKGFTGVTTGVLAATRIAVLARRRLQMARRGASGAQDGHRGVGTSASARWNPKMQKFKERTKQNIRSITKLRLSQDAPFRRPRGVNLAPRRAGPAEPLARKTFGNGCVAFLGDVQDVRAARRARGPPLLIS